MEGFHTTQDLIDSLLMAVSLAVAAVPEGLTAILTVVLALGVQCMAKHHAIVKKLSGDLGVGLGHLLRQDRHPDPQRNDRGAGGGPLRAGQPHWHRVHPQGSMTPVASQGLSAETEVDPSLADEVMETLMVGSIANDGGLRQEQEAGDGSEVGHGSGSGSGSESDAADQWQIIGDPTEVSLIVAARKVGADTRVDGYDRLAEIPFTSERKLVSVLALPRRGSGDVSDAQDALLFCKGAPDILFGRCDRMLQKGRVRPLTDEDREGILAQVGHLSGDAYRILGQAYRPLTN